MNISLNKCKKCYYPYVQYYSFRNIIMNENIIHSFINSKQYIITYKIHIFIYLYIQWLNDFHLTSLYILKLCINKFLLETFFFSI